MEFIKGLLSSFAKIMVIGLTCILILLSGCICIDMIYVPCKVNVYKKENAILEKVIEERKEAEKHSIKGIIDGNI